MIIFPNFHFFRIEKNCGFSINGEVLNVSHILFQTLPLSLLSKIQSGLSKEILPTLASQWDANLKGFKV